MARSRAELLLEEVQREADSRFADLVALLFAAMKRQDYWVIVEECGLKTWYPRHVWELRSPAPVANKMHWQWQTKIIRDWKMING